MNRRTARRSYLSYIEDVRGYQTAKHHRLLISKLQDVADGKIPRLMVFMPPGSAKSTYANVEFVPWYLGTHLQNNVITGSYGQELADKWGRRSRNIVGAEAFRRIFGTGLDAGSAAANRWATESGGEYLAVGVGGPVTGNRADLAVIDDPVKGREEADSETIREKTKEWYKDDLWTRLKPNAAIVLIMTRWHEDDLAGWLLEEAKKGGEQWEVLSLPWEAEANDALGRQLGERLWPEWFTDAMGSEAKRDGRRWSALYQQRPSPEEGNYFLNEWLRPYETVARDTLRVYGASDYAVTADGGDYTTHVIVGVDPQWNMYLLDLWRGQTDSAEWIEAFCDLVLQWKPLEWAEEGGQIKGAVGPFLNRRQLERHAYVARFTFAARADKATRAQSIRGRMAMRGLYVPMHKPWWPAFRHELLVFPAGAHDDQVDALGLIGQLLDKIIPGPTVEKPKPIVWPIQGINSQGVMLNNVSIRSFVERKERERAED